MATSPFSGYPLFLAKNFVLPQVDQSLEGPTPFNKDGGVKLWKSSGKLQLLQSLKCYLSTDLLTKVKEEIYLPTLVFKCRSQNKVCLTGHFWCWWKSHCSSSIATKDFGGAVSPLFHSAFTASIPHFSYKAVPQKINLFTLILYFSHIIPSSIAILLPTSLKSKAEQHSHFWNPGKRLLNITEHKHSIKYDLFDLQSFDSK